MEAFTLFKGINVKSCRKRICSIVVHFKLAEWISIRQKMGKPGSVGNPNVTIITDV